MTRKNTDPAFSNTFRHLYDELETEHIFGHGTRPKIEPNRVPNVLNFEVNKNLVDVNKIVPLNNDRQVGTSQCGSNSTVFSKQVERDRSEHKIVIPITTPNSYNSYSSQLPRSISSTQTLSPTSVPTQAPDTNRPPCQNHHICYFLFVRSKQKYQ